MKCIRWRNQTMQRNIERFVFAFQVVTQNLTKEKGVFVWQTGILSCLVWKKTRQQDTEFACYLPATQLNCLATTQATHTHTHASPLRPSPPHLHIHTSHSGDSDHSAVTSTKDSEALAHLRGTVTMQTAYQHCVTLTTVICALNGTETTGMGVQRFYKFNCALMSSNLNPPDAIWESDCPVRRAARWDTGLPKRNKHTLFWVVEETSCMTNTAAF